MKISRRITSGSENDFNLGGSNDIILEKQKSKMKLDSLSLRNVKMNFGIGLISYISFLSEYSYEKSDFEKANEYSKLYDCVLKDQTLFRSFEGWREAWRSEEYGINLRKVSLMFFGNSFAASYVRTSKIKKEYQSVYIEKIVKFYEGAANPATFKAELFNYK